MLHTSMTALHVQTENPSLSVFLTYERSVSMIDRQKEYGFTCINLTADWPYKVEK